jgi:hypothetical protein
MVACENEGFISPASFPPFHSLSTNVGDYRSFKFFSFMQMEVEMLN